MNCDDDKPKRHDEGRPRHQRDDEEPLALFPYATGDILMHDRRDDNLNCQQQHTTTGAGPQGLEVVKPESVQGDLYNLPPALAPLIALPHWVLWRWEKVKAKNGEKKWTKVPYQPDGRKAKNNDPETWSSYEAAISAHETGKFDGIGFCCVFRKNGTAVSLTDGQQFR
jgi:hypothetical protein